jgi:serine/threonine protein kinase
LAREARTLTLSSDHIVRVYDYAEAGEDAFLVMEFIEGNNLGMRPSIGCLCPERGGPSAPVCDALAYAHAKGVIHRDLTPANVLIERDTGRVVTTDFGLARIAQRQLGPTIGVLLGTPGIGLPSRRWVAAGDRRSVASLPAAERRSPFEETTGSRRTASCARGSAVASCNLARHRIRSSSWSTLLDRDPSRRPVLARPLPPSASRHRTIGRIAPAAKPRGADWPTVAFSPNYADREIARRRRRWLIPALAALAGVFGGWSPPHVLDHGIRAPMLSACGKELRAPGS